ncbi:MAG: NAD-dependent epimerase/dehydratase family protein [Flavobacteriales bacterium]|nr:NAD-dependent epimerase/dehydratase family protein [Flavobacteriales bacterium]
MRVAITGASGFIGRHLVQRLLAGPDHSVMADGSALEVRVLASSEVGFARCEALWPQVQRHLLFDPEGAVLMDALDGMDVLVHMGWSSVPAVAEKDPQLDQMQNVAAGLRLLDAATHAGVRRVIFLSSGGTVYGPRSPMPIKEDVVAHPNTAYGISKLMFEQYLRLHAQRNNLESIVLRPGNVYGDPMPRIRPQGVIEHWLACIAADRPIEIWSDLEVTRDFVHVDDMVRAILLSLTTASNDLVLNVGTGVGTSLGQLLEILRGVTGKDVIVDVRGATSAIIPHNVLCPEQAAALTGFRAEVELGQGVAKLWQQIAAGRELK